jgi:hypothetical protein
VRAHGLARVAATRAAEDAWTEHDFEIAERMLFTRVDSRVPAINKNLPDKRRRTFLLYAGRAPAYHDKRDEVAADAAARGVGRCECGTRPPRRPGFSINFACNPCGS